ncbi:methyltransferase domain-containing protein [Kribbella sp. NBC_01245]|uniref:methyltransferase domain-containing protein n=1 Tax=Kribbella sp. NBC_01245 TaxID=2903578 RepID=UPI002E29103F|nr:methyltransferase domain-containing protein [Kribbella sp. NBC_01245]
MVNVAFLDRIEETAGAAELRAESYRLLGLSPGQIVVDVGSGAGHAAAELVALGLVVTGVDPDADALEVARERAPGATFHAGTSERLPLADASVDGYRASRLFHLLADPEPTLAEARRVLRPGGRIVLVGHDYGFIAMDAADQDLTDVVLLGLESASVSPRAGRGLRNLLVDHGFRDVETVVQTDVVTDFDVMAGRLAAAADAAVKASLITTEDAGAWLADQTERGRSGHFLAACPTFLAAATR